MKIKKCPRCRSAKIDFFAAALTGQYHCISCGYIGSLIIEEDIPARKTKSKKTVSKKSKKTNPS